MVSSQQTLSRVTTAERHRRRAWPAPISTVWCLAWCLAWGLGWVLSYSGVAQAQTPPKVSAPAGMVLPGQPLPPSLGGPPELVVPQAMVPPRAPVGPVTPTQVLRWREEATLLEHGDNGLPRDPARAATLYCQAARHGDADAQFALAWMLTNGRGIERNDASAAYLFAAAAEQGLPQAQRMAKTLGEPQGEPPPCLRPPELDLPRPPVVAQAPGQVAAAKPMLVPALHHRLYTEAPRLIVDFVKIMAPDYQVAPQLVLAIMAAESGFNPNAVSPKNAQGLMQLIPETAARFHVRDPLNAGQNIRGGMAYLRWLLAFFEGDVPLVIAAYNAGEHAVERYRGVPPYAETRFYVRRVLAFLGESVPLPPPHPFDARITPPSPAMPLIRLTAYSRQR